MNFINWFKDKKTLIDENMKIRKGKYDVEQKYNEMLEDLDIIEKKYIDILEQKSERFDLYIKYENQCVELARERRELKKDLALAQEEITRLSNEITKLEKENKKLERKNKKLSEVEINAKNKSIEG